MSKSIRFVRRGQQGVSRHNFNWPGVIKSAKSVIQITAGEVGFGTTDAPPVETPGQDFYYKLGAASIWISNVSPHKNEFRGDVGGVEFLLHVDWDSPLDVGITITVEDDFPVEIQGY